MRAKAEGWSVAVVGKNTGRSKEIEDLGLEFIEMPVNPTGKNLRQEFRTLQFLYNLYGRERNAVVHHVGLKNMVWGGLAARRRGVKGVINAVSGLGIMFSDYNPSRMRKLLIPVLKYGMSRKNVAVIFQNHEDEALFQALGITEHAATHYIKGSGVDLEAFRHNPRPEGRKLRVIFAGRMVKDKGVLDLIRAAAILKKDYAERVEFVLCGDLSSNTHAVSKEDLERLCDGNYIKWLGQRTDMPELFAEADIMCFPSYYREGVPKAVLDASAAGLPIITCDTIGCRDTVKDGVNGFLVPPRAPEKIAEKLRILLDDQALRERMGRASREIAENEYDLKRVVDKHLEIYEGMLAKGK